jgi:FkbM family methyltransferase
MRCNYELFVLAVLIALASSQRECRNSQITYFAQHQRRFSGEGATEELKKLLLKCPHAARSAADELVVDVGANTGQSYDFLRAYSPSALAVLFEPNTASLAQLERATAADPNVVIYRGAVGEQNGTYVTFNLQFENKAENQHGSLSVANVYGNEGDFKLTVPMYSLDAVLGALMQSRGKRSVQFLKVDTEGFDQIVFYGAGRLLPSVNAVLWECHELQRQARGGPGTTIYESVHYLEQLGFHTYVVGDKLLRLDAGLYHPHYDVAMQWQNCFSVRRDQKRILDCIDHTLLPACTN